MVNEPKEPNEPDECPECDENTLRWDLSSGHWDCTSCGWSTEPDGRLDEDGDDAG